jgi:hypothetical protein
MLARRSRCRISTGRSSASTTCAGACERLRRPGSNTLQLGGDFVADPAGIVAYSRPQRRDDRPPVVELLRALEQPAR